MSSAASSRSLPTNADRAILGFAIASTPPCVLLLPERTHGKMRDGGSLCLRRRRYRISNTSGDSNLRTQAITSLHFVRCRPLEYARFSARPGDILETATGRRTPSERFSELPRASKHSRDFRDAGSIPVDDAVGRQGDLADRWVLSLGDEPARLRKRLKTLDASHELSRYQLSVGGRS
jgi:hypothetical protein